MTKKLEETFNLPPMHEPEDDEIEDENVDEYSAEEMTALMAKADKIDAALPQVAGLESADADYDKYADKAMEVFDDLVDLGKNVEDRHAADIFNAASSMMNNALNAKTNKAQKKLEMVKLQISNAKLHHEREKLDYLKARHLKNHDDSDDTIETEGKVVTTRNDLMRELMDEMKKDNDK